MGGPTGGYIKPLTSPPLCAWGFYPSGRIHNALDYPTPVGTKFRVARSGVVKVAGWSVTGFGNHIRVLMDDGNTVIYGHLSRFLVSVGQRVTAGQYIGLTGNTGNSTGPHLHMEVRSSSWAPWTAWNFTPFLVSAPTTTTATATPTTTTAPSFLERIMALSATDQNTFNGAVANALVYSLRNAPTVQLEIGKLIDKAVLEVLGYKNADIGVTKDVYAFIRGEEGTGRTNKDIAGAVDFSAVLDAINALKEELAAVKATVEALPKAEPQPVSALGIDVGKSQTTAQIVAGLAGKPDFCIVNSTIGLRSVSPALDANTVTARANADVVGFYHWAKVINDLATTPDKSDPVGEAQHFVSTVKPQPGDVVALDLEEQLGTWEQRVAYAIAWLDEVKRLTGAVPMIYLNWYWIKGMRTAATAEQWARLTAYPLWLAEYSGTPGEHSTVTAKDGSSQDSWPIVCHQYVVADNLDRDWTPDINKLKSIAVQGV